MEKKDYKKPTMRIVEVQQQCLLEGESKTAGANANRSAYGNAINQEWE